MITGRVYDDMRSASEDNDKKKIKMNKNKPNEKRITKIREIVNMANYIEKEC